MCPYCSLRVLIYSNFLDSMWRCAALLSLVRTQAKPTVSLNSIKLHQFSQTHRYRFCKCAWFISSLHKIYFLVNQRKCCKMFFLAMLKKVKKGSVPWTGSAGKSDGFFSYPYCILTPSFMELRWGFCNLAYKQTNKQTNGQGWKCYLFGLINKYMKSKRRKWWINDHFILYDFEVGCC